MADDKAARRAALEAEIASYDSTIATLREVLEGAPPGHGAERRLKLALEQRAERVEALRRLDGEGTGGEA